MQIVPVILSGGVGSRLWPLSRAESPKQLQRLLGDTSMIQATAGRLTGLDGVAAPVVVCGARHVEMIVEQLTDVGMPPALVIAEPVGRNTAPAVALAACSVPPDSVLLVLPADHVVTDVEAFQSTVASTLPAVREGRMVTFGIVPTSAETGYGYIEVGEGAGPVRPVRAFVEKPDAATAQRYLASGRHLWNSGMFVFEAGVCVQQLEQHEPAVLAAVSASLPETFGEGIVVPGPEFERAPSISFDYAVMERTDRAVVAPLDAGWSDVGSWATLWELEEKDARGNAVRGDVLLVDTKGAYVRGGDRVVALVGVEDLVVIDTGDALLVAARDRVQDVKRVVEGLAGRPEIDRSPPEPQTRVEDSRRRPEDGT